MKQKELTCVVCPSGCRITVTIDDDGEIISIKGNTCQRGKNYAESEVTNPVRTLTSTVTLYTKTGKIMLPVRTDKPIRKSELFHAMELIRKTEAVAPIRTGEILYCDFIEKGTNLVACKDVR